MLITMASVWGYAILDSGHKISDMDWDSDGDVEFSEILYATEVGKRTYKVDGKECTEFFLWKDASPVRLVCDGKVCREYSLRKDVSPPVFACNDDG